MRRIHTAIAAVAVLALAPAAWAQTVGGPVSRGDVSGTLGWMNVNKDELDNTYSSSNWYNQSLYGGAGLGWYWTDHWKTDIEFGVSTSAELTVYTQPPPDGRTASIHSHYAFGTRRLAIGQHYQFFRNEWLHPSAGVGLDLTWEQTDRTDEIYSAFPVRTTVHPSRTELLARPFATFALKAYMTPRAFVRTDMKLVFDKGIDEVFLRLAIGVDF